MSRRATAPLSLGLDLGGTWLRCCLAGTGGRILRRARRPAVRPRELPRELEALRRLWRWRRLDNLVVGSTGVWQARERKALAASLRKKASRVRVLSDLELAHEAAFGAGPGIIVVAGTGSAALGRRRGDLRRAGGWGALLGDEGSAFWIGRWALKTRGLAALLAREPGRLALRLAHAPDPVRRTAALARRVLAAAAGGHRPARRLRTEAARELAGLAWELARDLEFSGAIPVSWHGSLFRDRGLRETFLRELRRKNPGFTPRPARIAPELAAALSTRAKMGTMPVPP